jgi:hypothetical protein
MMAGFIPEQWPASRRNAWPTSIGIIRLDRAGPVTPRSTIGMKDAEVLLSQINELREKAYSSRGPR